MNEIVVFMKWKRIKIQKIMFNYIKMNIHFNIFFLLPYNLS